MSDHETSFSIQALPMGRDRDASYAEIRARGPIVQTVAGPIIVSHGTVEYVLRHPELFSSKRAYDGVGSKVPMLPIAFDPPEHTRYRHLLYADHFSRRRIELKEPEIRALAAELVDTVAGKGECEFVEAVAVPLPAQVFLTMFGLPQADRDKLIAWKNRILGNSAGTGATEAAPQATAEAAAELLEYLIGHIARRRAEPDDSDLLGRLLAAPSDERMSDHELLGLSFQFVLAGLDTVTSALANAMTILAARPELRQRIVDDPGIIPAAIEELLRIDGPVVTLPRIATQDVELDGAKVAEGCPVHVSLAVANRDPAEYANPDAIDFDRGEAHLAFGIGPHLCLGTHLARLEMRVALEEWHRRIPTYALTKGAEPAARWPAGLIGVTSVPLSYP